MTGYFIEPGDWEAATGESLPSGSNGIEVVPVAELKNYIGEFAMWLDEQIEDADAAYRKQPGADTAIRPLVLKHVASQYRICMRDINQLEETCEDSK